MFSFSIWKNQMNAVDPNTWTGAKVSTTSTKSPQLSFHTLTHSDEKILQFHIQTLPFENHILQSPSFLPETHFRQVFQRPGFRSLHDNVMAALELAYHTFLSSYVATRNAVDIWLNIAT